jgi:uncharacterized protein with GYD domain
MDRFGPASQSINAVGGELKQMYQTAEGVAFLIIDAPDAQTITAISVAVQSIDRLEDIRIHRLQTTAEFAEGCRRAQQFRAVPQFPTR